MRFDDEITKVIGFDKASLQLLEFPLKSMDKTKAKVHLKGQNEETMVNYVNGSFIYA